MGRSKAIQSSPLSRVLLARDRDLVFVFLTRVKKTTSPRFGKQAVQIGECYFGDLLLSPCARARLCMLLFSCSALCVCVCVSCVTVYMCVSLCVGVRGLGAGGGNCSGGEGRL